jgi:hypothetical protein
MKLSDIRDALLEVIPDVFHYEAYAKPNKYIVWAEDTEAYAGYGDNKKTTQVIQGTIDYFTKEEYDSNVKLIQEKLNSIELAWSLNSIQYEEDTKFIHYEWVFELIGELI